VHKDSRKSWSHNYAINRDLKFPETFSICRDLYHLPQRSLFFMKFRIFGLFFVQISHFCQICCPNFAFFAIIFRNACILTMLAKFFDANFLATTFTPKIATFQVYRNFCQNVPQLLRVLRHATIIKEIQFIHITIISRFSV